MASIVLSHAARQIPQATTVKHLPYRVSVGACYQQIYRELTTYYSILLSYSSPVLDRQLPIQYRILFLTPVYNTLLTLLVQFLWLFLPYISIYYGIFPAVCNQQFAIAVTVYYGLFVVTTHVTTRIPRAIPPFLFNTFLRASSFNAAAAFFMVVRAKIRGLALTEPVEEDPMA